MFSVRTICLKGLVSVGGRGLDRGRGVVGVKCARWCVFQFFAQTCTFILNSKSYLIGNTTHLEPE